MNYIKQYWTNYCSLKWYERIISIPVIVLLSMVILPLLLVWYMVALFSKVVGW